MPLHSFVLPPLTFQILQGNCISIDSKQHLDQRLGFKIEYVNMLFNIEFIGLFTNEPLLAAAKPIMRSIAQQVNENVHLAILDGLDIVFIACEQTTHPIRYHVEVGQTQPAHITGVGKVLLSQFSDKTIKEMYADFPFTKLTANTIDSITKLTDTLKTIRSLGYGLDDNESYMGSKCYAGPIYNANQRMIASLSISIPFVRNEQDRDEEMVGLVQLSCRQITDRLKNL